MPPASRPACSSTTPWRWLSGWCRRRPRRKRPGPKEVGARRSVEVGWTQLQIAGNTFQEVDQLCWPGVCLTNGRRREGVPQLKPYSDSAASRGLLVNQPETLFPLLTTALRRGIQVETHAIGDRGNRIMLDLYERAFAAVPTAERAVAEPRWRIEHAQILDRSDIPRFAKLGVIASMQPSHAISDLFFAPARLGPERLNGAYAWQPLLAS